MAEEVHDNKLSGFGEHILLGTQIEGPRNLLLPGLSGRTWGSQQGEGLIGREVGEGIQGHTSASNSLGFHVRIMVQEELRSKVNDGQGNVGKEEEQHARGP